VTAHCIAKFGSSLSNHGVSRYHCAKRVEHTDRHDDSVSYLSLKHKEMRKGVGA